MCGISGIAYSSRSGLPVEEDVLRVMRDAQWHRGPDGDGLYIDGRIGLAHRRLSIVDLANGRQPMSNEDGSVHIIFNGEIYNHASHRDMLRAKGHVFATHCDTETIVHLYEEFGDRCVDYLRGMFAFAIWDARRRRLFIARDRLGVKPLYYIAREDGSLFFASEIKSFVAAGLIKPKLKMAALPEYLANRATMGTDTLFEGVQRLAAGHTLVWEDGRLNISRYWDLPVESSANDSRITDEEYIAQWRDLFQESVRLRLMADVPLGVFLSGGIDSSAIAAVMSQLIDEPVNSFSVAFDAPEANELEYARMAASACGTRHHEVIVSPAEFLAALPKLIWHEDEPIAHSASIALYFVSKLAQQHVKVVLTGEGSDELLAGYYRYRTTVANLRAGRLYEMTVPAPLRRLVAGGVGLRPLGGLGRKLGRTFLMRPATVKDLYFDNFSVFPVAQQRRLLQKSLLEELQSINPYGAVQSYFDSPADATLLQRLLYTDMKGYLHELLMKQDQMSMAASIESRVPFLDHKLSEFSFRMPDRMKLRGWTTKYVLRKAMQGIVPHTILHRPKMGFPVPLARWFRNDFRQVLEGILLGERAASRNMFDRAQVKLLLQQHASGQVDHADRLWSLLNLEIWQRVFIDGQAPAEVLSHPGNAAKAA